ncbi:urease accessory protein UreH domain-containing protein [Caproicibacter sp. BJN0012]
MMLETDETELELALNGLDGVRDVKASSVESNVRFSYDPEKIKLKKITKEIYSAGYISSEKATRRPESKPVPPPPMIILPEDAPALQSRSATDRSSDGLIRKTLKIGGMFCTGCEMRIENRLKKVKGVVRIRASYAAGSAEITYDPRIVPWSEIAGVIEKLGYQAAGSPEPKSTENGRQGKNDDRIPINHLLGIGIIILAAYQVLKNTVGFNFIPNVTQGMGYGLLFVVGLITSLHCVAMCGGINLSQAVSYKFSEQERKSKLATLKPSLLYNAGRVLSYTMIGGIVGALGSAVSFSGTARGIVSMTAGIFMVIMGLNMLNIFPWLRRFIPHMPKIFVTKFHMSGEHGPFFVGLFNGLMPCGPLQAMQLYALGTGSPVKGALSMLVFSLGTVPLMFGFGAVSSFLSSKFTHKIMRVSAALVMVLGVVMLNRGFSLSGINPLGLITAKAASQSNAATVKGDEQEITTQLQANSYTPITVQKGIPVKWTIRADAGAINGCNGTVTIPQYNIAKTLQPGDNEINFTPKQTGVITYTCSMGMITSTISVVEDISEAAPPASGEQPETGTGGSNSADAVGVAKISGNEQEVAVSVGGNGYSPPILVLQKGIPAKIKFNPTRLTSCNEYVVFPELNSQLDLSSRTETPVFTPQSDFSFQCGMGMLGGYVKVVDDISQIDINAIQNEAENYVSAGGMSCCQ